MKHLLHVIDTANEWAGRFAAALLFITMIIVIVEVVLRYVFNNPTLWAMEVAQYTFVALILLAGGYTLLYKAHINCDILYGRWSPKTRARVDLFTFVFFLMFCIPLLWYGVDFFWESFVGRETSGTQWDPAIYPVKLMIVIGAFLLLLQRVSKACRDIQVARSDREEPGDGH